MRTFENSYDIVNCFDEIVYLQERNLIRFHHDPEGGENVNVLLWTNIEGSHQSPIAVYEVDSNYDVIIDMTDYLRTYPNVTTIYVECKQDDPIAISVQVKGNNNPKNALSPDNIDGVVIDIPSVILAPIPSGSGVLKNTFELLTDEAGWSVNDVAVNAGGIKLVDITTQGNITIKRGTYTRIVPIKSLLCGHKYAAVRWVSYTGNTRCATFEVQGVSIAQGDSITLENIEGEFSIMRGRKESFKIVLNDCTAYDIWYYGDMITSSKVEVSLDGKNFKRVEVADKSVTIPNGDAGKLNKLEISINYSTQDAIVM